MELIRSGWRCFKCTIGEQCLVLIGDNMIEYDCQEARVETLNREVLSIESSIGCQTNSKDVKDKTSNINPTVVSDSISNML